MKIHNMKMKTHSSSTWLGGKHSDKLLTKINPIALDNCIYKVNPTLNSLPWHWQNPTQPTTNRTTKNRL